MAAGSLVGGAQGCWGAGEWVQLIRSLATGLSKGTGGAGSVAGVESPGRCGFPRWRCESQLREQVLPGVRGLGGGMQH